MTTSISKNEKQLVNEYCQREKFNNPLYVCTPDNEKITKGFFCTLTVNGETFCTPNWEKSKKLAELEAAKLAVKKLTITDEGLSANKRKQAPKDEDGKTEGKESKKGKTNYPNGKDPAWIAIEKVEDIYKYLTDEVLAQEFKSFLHCKAQEEKKPYPLFTHEEVEGKGYTAKLTYDGKDYKSLGVMMTKKQAEQSASEVCLRALGDFPAVSSEDQYTIQIYKGGKAIPKKTWTPPTTTAESNAVVAAT